MIALRGDVYVEMTEIQGSLYHPPLFVGECVVDLMGIVEMRTYFTQPEFS